MNQLARQDHQQQAQSLEELLLGGDLKTLTPQQRLEYYNSVCQSLDLNPLTRPFDYITLNGKLTLYARKDATEQLRKRDRVSVTIVGREVVEGVYVVTARATTPDGRADESIGAVSIEGLKGEARANAMMKSETKSKRRVTLSICGLGFLDESEVETVPSAIPFVEEVPRPPRPVPDWILDLQAFAEDNGYTLAEARELWEPIFGKDWKRGDVPAMKQAIIDALAANVAEEEQRV